MLASHVEPAIIPTEVSPSPASEGLPVFGSEFVVDELVAEVLRRNPSMQVAWAAWAAAAERSPQMVALDDPLLQSMLAPGSLPSSSNVQSSYYIGVAQKFPWWGKRELRGQVAQWEANAMALDSHEVELRLTEAARLAYYDYFLVTRELDLNRDNQSATEEFRRTAGTKYESNLVTQQDVLQAEVELGKLESRQIELEQTRRVTVARINTLLHRSPDHLLPPPPTSLPASAVLPSIEQLRQTAVEQRPDLAALASRIQAEEASLQLACREFYPDFEIMGRYDRFWTDREQRPQIGMNVNIPLNRSRREAAVREAQFRIGKLQAEYQQQVDGISLDVESAFARLDGSRQMVALYVERILPAARASVESANSGYIAGTVDFLRLITAQRELIDLQEKHVEAVAEQYRRIAELDRVVGASSLERSL